MNHGPTLSRRVNRPETLCGLRRPLIPLVLSTIAAQSSIVVLVPIVVEVARDLDASVSAVGQARTVLAVTAVVAALFIGPLIDRLGVRPLLTWGSTLALLGAGASAAAPSLALYLLAHVITGTGVACLLSAGFAGVGAWFPEGEMARPMGFVVGAQSISWIIGNPIIGILTDAVSWRAAYIVPGVICLAALVAAWLSPAERDAAVERPPGEREGLRAVFRDRSARRWTHRRVGRLFGLDGRAHLHRRLLHPDLRHLRVHGGIPARCRDRSRSPSRLSRPRR